MFTSSFTKNSDPVDLADLNFLLLPFFCIIGIRTDFQGLIKKKNYI